MQLSGEQKAAGDNSSTVSTQKLSLDKTNKKLHLEKHACPLASASVVERKKLFQKN